MNRSNSIGIWLADRFELGRHADGDNLRSMEGLRGLAVFLVYIVHYATLIEPWSRCNELIHDALDVMHSIGNAGVDLFFVLSGFLIYGTLIERDRPIGPYFRRRVRRIYPAFLVVFGLYVVLSLLQSSPGKIPDDFGRAMTYLVANLLLLPGIFPIEPLITVAWSLSYEMTYYVAMPALIGVLGLRGLSRPRRIAFFSLLTVAAAAAFAELGGPVRLLMFLSGVLLHEWLKMSPRRVPGPLLTLVVTAATLASMAISMPGPLLQLVRTGAMFVGFAVLCMACFARPDQGTAQLFSWTPLRWLGNMSYSYYLLHGLSLQAAIAALSHIVPADGLSPYWAAVIAAGAFVPAFLFTLVPCAFLFLAVERPLSLAVKPAAMGRPVAASARRSSEASP